MLVNVCLLSTVAIKSRLNCRQFTQDYEIVLSLPFAAPFNPLTTNSDRIRAFMDNDNRITKLFLYKENNVPLNIFCLKNLVELTINETAFINGECTETGNIITSA